MRRRRASATLRAPQVSGHFPLFPPDELRQRSPRHGRRHDGATAEGSELISANPVVVVQGVGQLGRSFLGEIGSMFWFIINTVAETLDNMRRGRAPFRASSFFRHTERAGVGSVPLVAMVSFFLGLTMALLTGYQLERFGTERLVPGLVAIAFTRELGPLAHRDHARRADRRCLHRGARHDAGLRGSGSDRSDGHQSAALPGRAAHARADFAHAVPAVISSVAAIFATSLISRAYFNIAWVYFTDLVLTNLLIRDIITGFIKSFLFGLLIGAIACYRGLNVKGGAAGVGTSTTSSVVTAITAVIAFDTIFNIVYVVFFP